MKEVYLLGLCRTAVGSFGGSFADLSATDLGKVVIEETLRRSGVRAEDVDEVLLGNVLQAGQGQNPARIAAMKAGIPEEAPAATLNKVCGSGLYSVAMAYRAVKSGECDCVVAGGMESMSNAPYLSQNLRKGTKMGNVEMVDEMIVDGLWDHFHDYHMGITAENVAEKFGISREEQDAFACASQRKAAKAQEEGKFDEEIVPVAVPRRKQEDLIVDKDEYIRPGTTVDKIAKLRPAFKPGGTVTAANASGINDGAAAFVVASGEFVKAHGLKPMVKVVSTGSKGVAPEIMGMGPVPSVKDALKKAGLTVDDIGLVEANEAFASQALAVVSELGIDSKIVNVNGGAIAIGHPIGASGARILTTLVYEMKRQGVKMGLATLCIGGGMGEAIIVENV